MSKHSLCYEFAGLCFFPETMRLEVSENGQKMNLTPTHCRFLLALLEKAQETVSYDELRQSVWLNQKEMTESFKRLIQTTKGDVVKLIRRLGVEADFIESVKGEGYRLNAKVTIREISASAARENLSANENEFAEQPPIKNKNRFFGEHAAFILPVSLFYGLLYWIAMLLEIAYQFDRFRAQTYQIGLPLVLWIGGTMFFGLRWTENSVRKGNRFAFFGGLAFLFAGTILACSAMWFFLPNEPVTAARFQSQPAFSAFLKNSLIYFLPLGVIFVLVPFHFVCVRKNAELSRAGGETFPRKAVINLRFTHLFGLWSAAAAYSIFSTFYLLDNLLPAEYHGLFAALLFVRFFVYFGLGLACLLWYKSTLNFAAE
jgi:DNA-binding winged helix-turn-helix (wHTH) protein